LAQAEAALCTLAVFFETLPDPAAREAAARLHWAAGKLDEARRSKYRSKYEAKAAKAAAKAADKPEGRFANIATAVVIGAILGGFLLGSIF
jgi:hypothetical protein